MGLSLRSAALLAVGVASVLAKAVPAAAKLEVRDSRSIFHDLDEEVLSKINAVQWGASELDLDTAALELDANHPPKDGHNLTIYQAISGCKYTSKFAELVDRYDDIVKLLNSTKAGNLTLFVPVDEGFEHLPEKLLDPENAEWIEKMILYHVLPDVYPLGRLLGSSTVGTAYNESWLGDKPQRIRVGFGLGGVRLNFFHRIVAHNIVSLT